jgi:uncharacterized membrane protein
METYEKLPTTKVKNGYKYIQVKRTEDVAMYEMKNSDYPEDTSVAYEVFKIVVGKPYTLVQKHGNKKGEISNYPSAEKFPGNESFGLSAWCYNSLDMADKKYNQICSK